MVGFGVEEDEFRGEEVIGCDGEKEEASVKLLTLAEEAVVRAVLNGGAIGGEVDAGAGEPLSEVAGGLCLILKSGSQQATDPHSFIW